MLYQSQIVAVDESYFFSFWATGSFVFLKILCWFVVGLHVAGLHAMMMPCGCNSLLVVSEIVLMFGSVIFCIHCLSCAVKYPSVLAYAVDWMVRHFLIHVCGYPVCWRVLYRQSVSFYWPTGLLQCACANLNNILIQFLLCELGVTFILEHLVSVIIFW